MSDGFDEVNKALNELMASMRPGERKKAIRKALTYLNKENKKRITAQKNVDGSTYKVRKQSVNVGKTRVLYRTHSGEEQSYVGTLKTSRRSNSVKLVFDDGGSINLSKDGIISKKKVRANKKKMLTGFRKFIQLKMFGANKGVLNIKKGASPLARAHHFGERLKSGADLPARQLLGMSKEQRLKAIQIMLGEG